MDNAGNVLFIVYNEESQLVDQISAPIELGKWTHVAATLDDEQGEMRIYLDGAIGVRKITSTRPRGSYDPIRQPGIGIGNTPNTGGYPFIGLIDEVLPHSRALSEAEIKRLASPGVSN